MDDSKPSSANNASALPKPSKAPPRRNPAFRMMGLPNFKFKLPSRNWLIFLSVTGSLASAIFYDRHYKKKAQQKWCRLVSHIANEPLQTGVMPRKLMIFLSAPPADTLKASREYFNDYVKPVLVAGAVDWEVIEGRKEGDVRAGLAEKIRELRKQNGEVGSDEPAGPDPAAPAPDDLVREIRRNNGIKEWDGTRGDIVIGRHTWKEYIRGLHEGWLGPLDPPPASAPPPSPPPPESSSGEKEASTEEKESSEEAATESSKEPPKAPPKPSPTPPFIPASMSIYTSASLPPTLLGSDPIQPSSPLPLPHILGFLNTPIRFWRFLHRRRLADQIGRDTAAVVLASYTRPYSDHPSSPADSQSSSSEMQDDASPASAQDTTNAEVEGTHELSTLLAYEEPSWHKSVRKRAPPDETGSEEERVWLDDVIIDPRIAVRMRRFELAAEDEAQAKRMAEGKESQPETSGDF